jgi:hypothetical protein
VIGERRPERPFGVDSRTDMDRNPAEQSAGRHGVGFTIAAVVVIPVLYIVLSGPLAGIHPSCPRPVQKGIEFIYFPLERVDEHLPGTPITRYVELWRK